MIPICGRALLDEPRGAGRPRAANGGVLFVISVWGVRLTWNWGSRLNRARPRGLALFETSELPGRDDDLVESLPVWTRRRHGMGEARPSRTARDVGGFPLVSIPMIEKRSLERRTNDQQVIDETSMLIPLPPHQAAIRAS